MVSGCKERKCGSWSEKMSKSATELCGGMLQWRMKKNESNWMRKKCISETDCLNLMDEKEIIHALRILKNVKC